MVPDLNVVDLQDVILGHNPSPFFADGAEQRVTTYSGAGKSVPRTFSPPEPAFPLVWECLLHVYFVEQLNLSVLNRVEKRYRRRPMIFVSNGVRSNAKCIFLVERIPVLQRFQCRLNVRPLERALLVRGGQAGGSKGDLCPRLHGPDVSFL